MWVHVHVHVPYMCSTGYAKMFFIQHKTQHKWADPSFGALVYPLCMLVMLRSKCYIIRTPSDVLVFLLLQSILFFEPQQQPTATERPTHCSVATKEPWRALVPSASIRHSRRATFGLAFLVVAAYRVWRPGHFLCLIIELSPSLPIVIFGSCQSSG